MKCAPAHLHPAIAELKVSQQSVLPHTQALVLSAIWGWASRPTMCKPHFSRKVKRDEFFLGSDGLPAPLTHHPINQHKPRMAAPGMGFWSPGISAGIFLPF